LVAAFAILGEIERRVLDHGMTRIDNQVQVA
jgi:hypothetical protein